MKLRPQEERKVLLIEAVRFRSFVFFSNDQRLNRESKSQPYLTSNVFIMMTKTYNRKKYISLCLDCLIQYFLHYTCKK